MASNPKRSSRRGGTSAATTPPATTPSATTPATSPAATTAATAATAAPATVAAVTASAAAASTAPANKREITRLTIGPTGPWYDEDGNSCLIWTPRGYNVNDNAVKTKIHLVADRPFFLYPVGQPRPAAPLQYYDVTINKVQAVSHMIVVTTPGSMEIDVTVPSRRLSIENIWMPGARRQSIAVEGALYVIAIAIGLYLFGWHFAKIAGGVAGTVLLGTILYGAASAGWHGQGQRFTNAVRWVFASDNRLWLVWSLMCITSTGIAVTHPGSGLIAPAVYEASKDPDTIAHEERMQRFHNLSLGRDFKSDQELGKAVPYKPQPKDWGWFWVNAYFWTWWWIIMVPTFMDDARAIIGRIWQKTWRSLGGEASLVSAWSMFLAAPRREKITIPRRPSTEQTAPATAGEIGSSVFWHSLSANLITELPSILHAIFRR